MINFINPYNFIPMGKSKGEEDQDERTYTGVIEYSVLTKSPLFIPNTSNDKTFEQSYKFALIKKKGNQEHKSYDFYSYQNLEDVRDDKREPQTWENEYFRPMIPGSEIRGMFRSNFEILTNSCMSVLDTDERLSKRTMERFQAGLIYKKKNGNFDLYEAQDVLWRTKGANNIEYEQNWEKEYYIRECYVQNDFPEGCHVLYEEIKRGKYAKPLAKAVEKYGIVSEAKLQDGYIIKGDAGPKLEPNPKTGISSQKHCCHIFRLKNRSQLVQTDISLDRLELILQEYKIHNEASYKQYREKFNEFREGEVEKYFPVYYSVIKSNGEEILSLSPACITREIYEHTLSDLAEDLRPCENKNKLCPACSLFGTVMKDAANASRIRFSDLEGEEKSDYQVCYELPTTLPPLSSPKLNNMEFYLQRPKNAWFWTYDYYIDADGKLTLQQGKLAGRKFYWHNAKKLEELKRVWKYKGEANQLNITVRPVKNGYTFKGWLYFKKVTQKELDLLIYLINAGDDGKLEEKKHGYKLGAAKPLGFGSVACHVDQVNLIAYQKDDHTAKRNVSKYTPKYHSHLVDDTIEKNFEKMTNFETISEKERICYPLGSEKKKDSSKNINSPIGEGNEGYLWFVQNHGGYNRGKQQKEEMASSRANMLFKEYMEAMEPKLKQTFAGGIRRTENSNKNMKSHNKKSDSNRRKG